VIKVADQLANALAHCHKLSVKHGDIKSNNVKFNVHSGNYVLLDFGLSAMTDDQRRTSIQHAGAIEFMAPEQNDGQLLLQTDVYSYGIILYELLAGQVPFPLTDQGQKSRNQLMLAHMEQEVPDLMTLRRKNLPESWSDQKKMHEMQVPQWLLQVIEKCLKKDPLQRFGNGVELQDFIIHNSISSATEPLGNEWRNLPLTTEQEIEGFEQPDDADTIRIARPVFYAMLVLMVVMTGALGLLLFGNLESEKDPVEQVSKKADTVKDTETRSAPRNVATQSRDVDLDSLLDTSTIIKPLEKKPVIKPSGDSTKLDLDTTVYF